MLITDQVATAPCTDCVQAQRPTFEAKPVAPESLRWRPSIMLRGLESLPISIGN